jgi:hypothetical protein
MLLAGMSSRAQDHTHPFQFTPADERPLAEANELDGQFEKKGLVFHEPKAEAYLISGAPCVALAQARRFSMY